jgi:hypothetical protein
MSDRKNDPDEFQELPEARETREIRESQETRETNESAAPSHQPLSTDERVEMVRQAKASGDLSGQDTAVRGIAPRGPNFRDEFSGREGGSPRHTFGVPENEEDLARVENELFNQPDEKQYTEGDIAAAKDQHDLALAQARRIQGKTVPEQDDVSADQSGAPGVSKNIDTTQPNELETESEPKGRAAKTKD